MTETGLRNGAYGADKFGFKDLAWVHWNLDAPMLYEHAIAARECTVVQGGAICAETGVHTGRSPKDKHTVVDALTENTVWWDGNRKITPAQFQLLSRGYQPNPTTAQTQLFTVLSWGGLIVVSLIGVAWLLAVRRAADREARTVLWRVPLAR